MQIRVDYLASLSYVGTILKYLSLSLFFPIFIAIIYQESLLPFILTILVTFILGSFLERLKTDIDLGKREGFLIVGLTWIFAASVGALPYIIAGNGTIAHPINALFEGMSGFTTTGATVMEEISFERHSRSILMWRQITQWIGGMGIIVLMVAILPQLSVGGASLMDSEAPGLSVEKLTPRIAETARILWGIYILFTIVLIILLYTLHISGFAPNMNLYNSIAHAFTTMPTGGFSPESRSIEAFSGPVQWLIIIFMIFAGTNFALFWHALNKNPKKIIKNSEFRLYILSIIIFGSIVSILLFIGFGLSQTPENVLKIPGNIFNSLRQGVFQVAAIITTTGYASMDFNTWSETTKYILLFGMFLGGSAGSAAGSIKIIRWYIILKTIKRELFTTIHPDSVVPVRISREVIDERSISGVHIFTLTFILLFFLSTVFFFLDSFRTGISLTVLEAMSTSIATLGNVGPGFGIIGPMGNYLSFSYFAKLYMIFLMWIGRVEIISILILFTPSYWKS